MIIGVKKFIDASILKSTGFSEPIQEEKIMKTPQYAAWNRKVGLHIMENNRYV